MIDWQVKIYVNFGIIYSLSVLTEMVIKWVISNESPSWHFRKILYSNTSYAKLLRHLRDYPKIHR